MISGLCILLFIHCSPKYDTSRICISLLSPLSALKYNIIYTSFALYTYKSYDNSKDLLLSPIWVLWLTLVSVYTVNYTFERTSTWALSHLIITTSTIKNLLLNTSSNTNYISLPEYRQAQIALQKLYVKLRLKQQETEQLINNNTYNLLQNNFIYSNTTNDIIDTMILPPPEI